jgi:hypothetical protein
MISTHETRLADDYAQRNLERIEVAYLQAIREGAEGPIILALDLRDPRARAVAEAAGMGEEVRDHLATAEARGMVAGLCWGMPGRVARSLVALVDGEAAAALERPMPPGYFVALGFSGGGFAILELPEVCG